MNPDTCITLKNITKKWPQPGLLEALAIFSELSYTFEPGSRTAIAGPPGSGKTTLLQMISGLEAPDSGDVDAPRPPSLGYVFQTAALWPHLTVRSNIRYGLGGFRFYTGKLDVEEWFQRLLDALELGELLGKYPATLSGGQAKRVSLARTLIIRPTCLLLDEPLSALDQRLKDRVTDFLLEYLHQTHATLLYVTHDQQEARRICPHLLQIRDRKLVPSNE